MRALSALCLLLTCCSAWPQSPTPQRPLLIGYITRISSGSDFDVNGVRILCGGETRIQSPARGDASFIDMGCFRTPPVVGQRVEVYGHRKKQPNAVVAERIDIKRIHHDDISGWALIDAIADPDPSAPRVVRIRADGYWMTITPRTRVAFNDPLHSISDVMTNVWVRYSAKPGPDGTYAAQKAKFFQNSITENQDAKRAKTDYDPATVPANAKQNALAATIEGPNPKQMAPWPDEAMQHRVSAIGHKLVPSWENKLADSDPTKINFRFQVTSGHGWPLPIALPSGVVLVPHESVERMQNDSQLAAILADAMACVLEKQYFRMSGANNGITAGTGTEVATILFSPAWGAAVTSVAAKIHRDQRQSARVSLDLMHDAGYDVDEAPKAWWLLDSRKPQPLEEIAMPDRAAYLYRVLGEVWGGTPGMAQSGTGDE
ncbi:MAG TPA: DUF5666 domain-containing protein [Acidobacteriaceae bacterium]|nr:DUF5666 domain-containing protein [Acidobacteriaceae bacterium]